MAFSGNPLMHGLQGLLLTHFVGMRVTVPSGDFEFHSGFVLSIDEEWLWVTAGHCIQKTEAALKAFPGTRLELIDALRPGAKFNTEIPFAFEEKRVAVFNRIAEDEGFDCGMIWLRPIVREQLRVNGIVALNELTWRLEPAMVEAHMLLGVPKELVSKFGNILSAGSCLMVIRQLSAAPEGFRETTALMFYAEVERPPNLSTLKGMSGGPIFAFGKVGEQLKYWLHALQSGEYGDRYVSACVVRPYAVFADEALAQMRARADEASR